MSALDSRRPAVLRPVQAALALALGLVVMLLAFPGTAVAAGTAPAPIAEAPGGGWVRAGHFIPGMGAADVTLTRLDPADDTRREMPLATDATYGVVSPYEKLEPGSYTATISIGAAGDDEPLLSRSFDVGAGEARTIALVGTVDMPRLALLSDDLTLPSPGTARVRLLSASEAAGPVTVAAVDGPTIAEGAVLGQATPYRTVPAGDWTLELSGESASGVAQSVPVASGSVYTVVALDAPGGGVSLQVVTDAAGAVVAPRGGAKTGYGGAQASTGSDGDLLASALVGGAVLVTVLGGTWGRRRTRLLGER